MIISGNFIVPKSASGGVENVQTQSLATATSGAEIVIGPRQLFAVTAFALTAPTGESAIHIKFGPAGLSAATASDMAFPTCGPTYSVLPIYLATGDEFNSIRIFNNTSATVNVYVMLVNANG